MIKPQITYPHFVNTKRPLEFELCPRPFEQCINDLYWNEIETRIIKRTTEQLVKYFQND